MGCMLLLQKGLAVKKSPNPHALGVTLIQIHVHILFSNLWNK